VPDVDLDLESEMRERIGFKQLAAHAAAAGDASLTEESAAVAAVNAWAAAGCTLDAVDELEAAQAVAAAAAAFDIDAAMLENNSWGEKLAFCRDIFCLLVTIAIIAAFLFILNDGGEVSGLPHAHTQRPQRLLMLAPPPSRIFTLHTSRVTPPAALP
tara:strand:- start:1218 stop:1688 length:471 start_codon:yes stop_codon:yes gene_type:complete